MAEPTGGMTFGDLIIRVAEYLGIANYGAGGDESAQVPTDPHDLALCQRLVNDGIRRFISDHANWRWMRKSYILTLDPTGAGGDNVDNDSARYIMPDGFGGDTSQPVTYGTAQDVWGVLETVPESLVRAWRSASTAHTGEPRYIAFRPLEDDEVPENTRGRWEAIFYPDPGSAYVIAFSYRHFFTALTTVTQRQPAGIEFDEAVKAAAIALAEIERDDKEGPRNKYYRETALPNAIRLDELSAPRTVGPNLDGSGRGFIVNRRQLGYQRPVRTPTYGA